MIRLADGAVDKADRQAVCQITGSIVAALVTARGKNGEISGDDLDFCMDVAVGIVQRVDRYYDSLKIG